MDSTIYAAALAAIKDPVDQMTIRSLYETNYTIREISESLNVPRNHIYYLVKTYLGGKEFLRERSQQLGLNHLQDCADKAAKLQPAPAAVSEEDEPIDVITVPASTTSMAEIMAVSPEFDEEQEIRSLRPLQQAAYHKLCEMIRTTAPRKVPSTTELEQAIFAVRGTHPSQRDTGAARRLWLKLHPKFSDGMLPESEPDASALPAQSGNGALPIIAPSAPNPSMKRHASPIRIEINGLKLEWESYRSDTENAILEVLGALSKLTNINQIGVPAHE